MKRFIWISVLTLLSACQSPKSDIEKISVSLADQEAIKRQFYKCLYVPPANHHYDSQDIEFLHIGFTPEGNVIKSVIEENDRLKADQFYRSLAEHFRDATMYPTCRHINAPLNQSNYFSTHPEIRVHFDFRDILVDLTNPK